jgi:hypothetical protein
MKKLLFAITFAILSVSCIFLTTPALADCQSNLTQCLNGCDGATSCSAQCQTNYCQCMGTC